MRNARPRVGLTEYGGWLLVQRVERDSWTVAAIAEVAGSRGKRCTGGSGGRKQSRGPGSVIGP
jgi:hypothetical protein